MARQSRSERNRKQRDRQRQLRERQKEERRPDRDDIARIALHWMITRSIKTDNERQLGAVEDVVVERLVAQGFDKQACYAVFDDLVDKYADTDWAFRRKTHLLFRSGHLFEEERRH